jgi:hypothetical protein
VAAELGGLILLAAASARRRRRRHEPMRGQQSTAMSAAMGLESAGETCWTSAARRQSEDTASACTSVGFLRGK